MKSNGKIKNAKTLASKFGVFVSVGDMKTDLENAKAALAYRDEHKRIAERAELRKTMASYVKEHPESAEFFTGKHGKELCRVKAHIDGQDHEWCGEVVHLEKTAPLWIQTEEYMEALK